MHTRSSANSNPQRSFARVLTTFCALITAGLLTLPVTAAEFAPSMRIDVTPSVAPPGISRTIVANVVWPDACPPDEVVVAPEPRLNPQVLILRFNAPATYAPCAQVQTPISRQVTYTPAAAGVLPIIAATGTGSVLAAGRLVTAESGEFPNLNGLWMGASDDFSILNLTQSSGLGPVIVGTMNLFARDGSPQWRLIHSSRQSPHNTIYATVSAFSSDARTTCAGPPCPSDGFSVSDEGLLEIEVRSENEIVATARVTDPMFPSGLVRFRSVMYRFGL